MYHLISYFMKPSIERDDTISNFSLSHSKERIKVPKIPHFALFFNKSSLWGIFREVQSCVIIKVLKQNKFGSLKWWLYCILYLIQYIGLSQRMVYFTIWDRFFRPENRWSVLSSYCEQIKFVSKPEFGVNSVQSRLELPSQYSYHLSKYTAFHIMC